MPQSQVDTTALAAAVEALGNLMHVLNGRRLLARGVRNEVLRAQLTAQDRTDEELLEIASDAFEAATMALAAAGHPGAVHIECNGGIGSPEHERYMETRRKP